MKLLTFFVFVSMVTATASSYSQQTKFNLNLSGVTVSEVFREIETNSEFILLYNEKQVDASRKVDVKVENETVESILNQIFNGTQNTYKIYDRQIVILETEKRESPSIVNSETIADQKKGVSGRVTDTKGLSLPGVSVVVKGTTTGIVTDSDGKFTLSVPTDAKILVFSFVGMKSQEVAIAGKTSFNIVIEEEATGLSEVVAIGYGTKKKRDVVGSVATVAGKELVNKAYSDFNEMLQGKASGVFVSNGVVRIRGVNSISNSTGPLYVVDGVTTSGGYVNPNDIESVDIQKDAAATAIYGSRASGGVIMITTKSGKAGNNVFNIDVSSGLTSFINDGNKYLDATNQLAAMDLSIQNSRKYDPTILSRPFDPKDAFTYNVKFLTDENGNARNFNYFTRDYVKNFNTDQLKELTRQGTYKDINLTTSKSFEKGGLYFSLNYRDESSVLKGDDGNKINARLGMNFSPIKNLKFGLTSTVVYSKHTNGASLSSLWLPFMPLYDDTNPTGLWIPAANPLARANHNLSDNNQTSFGSSLNLTAEYAVPFVKGLSIKGTTGYDAGTYRNSNWSSKYMNDGKNSQPVSRADEDRNLSFGITGNIGINYNRSFGDHNISGVIFQEGSKSWSNYMNMAAEQLSSSYHEIGQSPGVLSYMNAGLGSELKMMSTLGRVSYKYKERYLLESSLRLDATSKFSPAKQNATFTSFGAGWIISDEDFFKSSVSWINLLKLRGSIGQTGNGNMPDFKYMNRYSVGKMYMNQQYSYIQNIGNPSVAWEVSDNKDIGIDFGILSNRINGSVAYFKKNVSGLLLQVPLPISAGITGENTVWQNIGDMSNSGVELNVNFIPIKTPNFSWDVSINFSTNENEILALHPAIDAKGWGIEGLNSITKKGGKLATFYMPEFAGIDPQKGIPLIYERDQTVYANTGETVKTGKLIPFNSITGSANRMIQKGKSSMPDWYGGFNNNIRYKNFDMSMMFTYVGNFYFVDDATMNSRSVSFGYLRLSDDIIANSWKKPGDNAKYPEIIYGGGFYYNSDGVKLDKQIGEYKGPSTQDLIKGNFLKLKTITFGYTLPSSLTNKLKINSMRVYVSANNAFTFSKCPKAIDPEMNIPGNLDGTTMYYGTPPSRTISFGLSLNF